MAVTINADTSNGLVMTPDTSGEIKLQSAGTDIATVNSSGITLATGKDLTLSSTALDASASGIYLGGTAAANLLDDYEEGTFTPTLTPASGSITSYANQLGYYTKVGNRVLCTIRIDVNNIGTASGDMTINGLPFANGQSYRVSNYGREDGFIGYQLQWWINGNNTNGVIRRYDDTDVGWNNSMRLLLVANYFTS